MRKRIWGPLLLIILSLGALAQERFTHAGSGLSMQLPAGWIYAEVDDHFEVTPPDESLLLMFFVAETNVAAEGIEAIGNELDKLMTESRITTDVTEEIINGLTHIYGEGDGLMDGTRVDWDFTMVIGGRKSMVVIGLGELERNQAVLDSIYLSIMK